MRLPCRWIRVYGSCEACGNVYADGKGVRNDRWGGKRITGRIAGSGWRTRFLEAAVATRIKQAYGGALACENAYEAAITLRIPGLDWKTITCRGYQRQQAALPADRFRSDIGPSNG